MKTIQKLIERMLNISSGVKTYNTNNGTLRVEWRKCLYVTALTLTIHTTNTWGTGSGNRITCTLDNDIPLPASIANGSELNGILCHISGSTFRAQNNTGSTLPANSNFNPTLTYLIGGYRVASILSAISSFVRRWSHEQGSAESAYADCKKGEIFNGDKEHTNNDIKQLIWSGNGSIAIKESYRDNGCLGEWHRRGEFSALGFPFNSERGIRRNDESCLSKQDCNDKCTIRSHRRIALISERGCVA